MNRPIIINGNCLDVMDQLDADSVDAVVTDPPYEINFMGRKWDRSGIAFQAETWARCLRVLKPGGHLVAFSATRTYHRIAVAIEDAGFEVRDLLAWMYGTGFPKALNISKAIDSHLGVERTELLGHKQSGLDAPGGGVFVRKDGTSTFARSRDETGLIPVYAPATPEAEQWDGWATTLKPALEPITLARKPSDLSHAANILEWGVGALNIEGCRIDGVKGVPASPRRAPQGPVFNDLGNDPGTGSGWDPNIGRWPANVLLDENAALALDAESFSRELEGVSRLFYVAKASRIERDAGHANAHPTVKPVELMRWLTRLVTPPDGIVLDPFLGSGTTAIAAMLEGFGCIGIELDPEWVEVARERLVFWEEHGEAGLQIIREREASEARRQALEDAGQLSLL